MAKPSTEEKKVLGKNSIKNIATDALGLPRGTATFSEKNLRDLSKKRNAGWDYSIFSGDRILRPVKADAFAEAFLAEYGTRGSYSETYETQDELGNPVTATSMVSDDNRYIDAERAQHATYRPDTSKVGYAGQFKVFSE